MGEDPEGHIEVIAGEILGYLRSRQNAADTVEGIARWWIKRQRLDEALAQVQAALDRLVSETRLEARVSPTGRTLYALPGDPLPSDYPSDEADQPRR